MDLAKVLQQLHEELRNLDAAIASLERLQESGGRGGQDPEWPGQLPVALPAGRQRKPKASKDPPKKA